MECKKENNLRGCTCSYPCSKRGMCCECVASHRRNGEIPGCFFSPEAEATYDRSIGFFIKSYKKYKGI
ncbi:MAG: hypothetical protein GX568_09045 [Candidatus Gastranaerophilales bacterium]|nr:hypothetical protein [Candidatus Gastranaerophilales bacterium]